MEQKKNIHRAYYSLCLCIRTHEEYMLDRNEPECEEQLCFKKSGKNVIIKNFFKNMLYSKTACNFNNCSDCIFISFFICFYFLLYGHMISTYPDQNVH